MDRYIARENIDRFRRMLEQTSDEATRQQILRLLKEEEDKLANFLKMDGKHL